MDIFLNAIKGQFNSLNFLLFILIGGFLFRYLNKRKLSLILFILAIVFFLATSTGYLPRYLITKMESTYMPFDKVQFGNHKDTIYIQSLGGGYTSDPRLNPVSQLSWSSLGRLAEAIRIVRLFDESVLVLSGNIASGNESLASVEKNAAIQLGVDSNRIVTLEAASTTQDEAEAFVNRFGKNANLIVVTDALHMPRAMKAFTYQGIKPFPAPTNYTIKQDENPFNLVWVPSIDNFQRMDKVWREYLGTIKSAFLKSNKLDI